MYESMLKNFRLAKHITRRVGEALVPVFMGVAALSNATVALMDMSSSGGSPSIFTGIALTASAFCFGLMLKSSEKISNSMGAQRPNSMPAERNKRLEPTQ